MLTWSAPRARVAASTGSGCGRRAKAMNSAKSRPAPARISVLGLNRFTGFTLFPGLEHRHQIELVELAAHHEA